MKYGQSFTLSIRNLIETRKKTTKLFYSIRISKCWSQRKSILIPVSTFNGRGRVGRVCNCTFTLLRYVKRLRDALMGRLWWIHNYVCRFTPIIIILLNFKSFSRFMFNRVCRESTKVNLLSNTWWVSSVQTPFRNHARPANKTRHHYSLEKNVLKRR